MSNEPHLRLLISLVALGAASAQALACSGKVDINFVGSATGECGDGRIDEGEECDDGATEGGDGCDDECSVEDGYVCDDSEPTVCAPESEGICGNDALEGEEECDDGNLEDGDGCSAECTVETAGECSDATTVALSAEGDGVAGEASASLSAGDGVFPSAPCGGGADVGGGAERIFSFTTNSRLDLDVRVTANLDTVVRLMTETCDPSEELACANAGGVSEEERVRIADAAPGTYFVVVDGVDETQEGNVTVNVNARCPLGGIKIEQVILSSAARRTVLFNQNAECGVDLSRVGVRTQPQASNTPSTLEETVLAARRKVTLTSQEPTPTGAIFHGSLTFDTSTGGAYYICRGACASNGNNVIDAVRFQGIDGPPADAALAQVDFDGALPRLLGEETRSYFRVAHEGSFPEFLVSDYIDAYFVDTFEDARLEDFVESGASHDISFEQLSGTVGNFSLRLSGGGGTGDGFRRPFRNHAGAVTPIQPTEIRLQVRASAVNRHQGGFYLGDNASGFEGTFLSLALANNGSVCVGGTASCGGGGAAAGSYSANAWSTIVIDNFDYEGATEHTAEISVGEGDATAIGSSTKEARQLYLFNPTDADVHIDQIVIR